MRELLLSRLGASSKRQRKLINYYWILKQKTDYSYLGGLALPNTRNILLNFSEENEIMNAKDNKNYTRIVQTEYKDAQGNIHTEYKDAQGNIHTEYKDAQGNIHSYNNGYIDGHLAEEQNQDARVERADKNTSQGLLIGVIVACVAGLTAGVIYFVTRPNEPAPVSIINVPSYKASPTPSASPPPVRVVEQPIVTIVPVPQPQTGESTVNITANPSASSPSSKQENVNAAKPSSPSPSSGSTTTSTPAKKPVSAKPAPAVVTPVSPPTNSTTTPTKKPAPAVTTPASPSNDSLSSPTSTQTDIKLKNDIVKQLDESLPNNQLMIDVKNSQVRITGAVETLDQLKQIQSLLNTIQGIKKVDLTGVVVSKDTAQ